MSITKQLYRLQEIDLEIEADNQTLQQATAQLGENQAVTRLQSRLAQEKQQLEKLRQQQHSAEWEIEGVAGKLTTAEEELYSGRIKNPKELSSLQQEVQALKTKRSQLEDRALEIMDRVEQAEASVAAVSNEVKTAEAEWQHRQQQLSAEAEELKTKLSDLNYKRESLLADIDPQFVELYHKLRKQKGRAVARVEQGICNSCRISLPITDLQRARSGNLIQCSSCGRILFQA